MLDNLVFNQKPIWFYCFLLPSLFFQSVTIEIYEWNENRVILIKGKCQQSDRRNERMRE